MFKKKKSIIEKEKIINNSEIVAKKIIPKQEMTIIDAIPYETQEVVLDTNTSWTSQTDLILKTLTNQYHTWLATFDLKQFYNKIYSQLPISVISKNAKFSLNDIDQPLFYLFNEFILTKYTQSYLTDGFRLNGLNKISVLITSSLLITKILKEPNKDSWDVFNFFYLTTPLTSKTLNYTKDELMIYLNKMNISFEQFVTFIERLHVFFDFKEAELITNTNFYEILSSGNHLSFNLFLKTTSQELLIPMFSVLPLQTSFWIDTNHNKQTQFSLMVNEKEIFKFDVDSYSLSDPIINFILELEANKLVIKAKYKLTTDETYKVRSWTIDFNFAFDYELDINTINKDIIMDNATNFINRQNTNLVNSFNSAKYIFYDTLNNFIKPLNFVTDFAFSLCVYSAYHKFFNEPLQLDLINARWLSQKQFENLYWDEKVLTEGLKPIDAEKILAKNKKFLAKNRKTWIELNQMEND